MPDDPGERSLIATLLEGRFEAPALRPLVDVGDDAAVLPGGLALSADAMVEGVHWDGRLSPEDVGWKLVASNVSDLGAMGATPSWALLTLCLPRPLDLVWVRAFTVGLHAACAHFGLRLVGGDCTASPGPRMLSLAVGGHAPAPVTRAGARPGDLLWVSGTLGEAAAGFFWGGDALAALRRPDPPVALGVALAEEGLASAMMDLSDGLALDLGRLCAASGVGAQVLARALPASAAVAAAPDRLSLQVAFGEDYELLFTSPAHRKADVLALGRRLGRSVHAIGTIDDQAAAGARLDSGPWPAGRFSHFEGASPAPVSA